jgi:hypothetical protein
MPNFDKTGPLGQGPMTGRRGGYAGRGMGIGRGRGYGCCFRQFPLGRLSKEDQVELTKEYLEDLKEEIKETEKYLKDLEG